MAKVTFTVLITEEVDGSFWAEVAELPGCFSSGFSLDELREATEEAIQLYLPEGITLGTPTWGPIEDIPKSPSRPSKSEGVPATKPRPRQRRALIHA